MTVKEALIDLKSRLSVVENGDNEARYILEKASGLSYSEMLFRYSDTISPENYNEAVKMASLRLSGEPIQYILGQWDFMDFTFSVGKGVLIPRPETELLTQYVLDEIKNMQSPVVYDLCSGSGCIGLSIKMLNKSARVYLVEKSPEALCYLKKNIADLCADERDICLIQGDILRYEDFDTLPEADAIVSNPPYIRSDEVPSLQGEVLREPFMALDGGEDGLSFYRVLVSQWSQKLKDGGFMAFECGEDQAQDICALFDKIGFDNKVINDYNNIQRIVSGRKKVYDI